MMLLTMLFAFAEEVSLDGVQAVSAEQVHELFPEAKGKPVFLEFKSKFCLACKKMDPILARLLPEYAAKGHLVEKVFDISKDRAANQALFQAFQPKIVPTQVYIYPSGRIARVYTDFHSEAALREALNQITTPLGAQKRPVVSDKASESSDLMQSVSRQFQQSLKHTSGGWTVLLAFAAGLISSFFPCCIGMLPILIGYMGVYESKSKWDVFQQVGVFILGLASVLTVLGIGLSLLGKTFGELNTSVLYYLVAAVCFVMALQILEWIHLPLPSVLTKLPEQRQGKWLAPYILGASFGLVSSPCGTPVLAAILGVISQQGDPILGGISLFAYAVGQGFLLMVVGLFTGLLKYRAQMASLGQTFTKISGVAFMLLAVIFLLQGLGLWNDLLLKVLPNE
ncbi:MAG: hypothetical protein K2X01_10330 [Cyanobacteria bacterium]|nr:hypothetical protein [Cyanobacteriota bacterium]